MTQQLIQSLLPMAAMAAPVLGWFYWASPVLQENGENTETDLLNVVDELVGCTCRACVAQAQLVSRAKFQRTPWRKGQKDGYERSQEVLAGQTDTIEHHQG